MSSTPMPILLSWSTGKDSAWALEMLRQDSSVEIRGLITTVNQTHDRVAMHAVRRELLEAQATAVDLPLRIVEIPHPCSNEVYEASFNGALAQARSEGIEGLAFGDLFLQDIRDYREKQLAAASLKSVFPLWKMNTRVLAEEMIAAGLKAVLTCVDPAQCPGEFAGEDFGPELLSRLPDRVDPCGENGEFHTFVTDGPMFRAPIGIEKGEKVERGGFVYADILPA